MYIEPIEIELKLTDNFEAAFPDKRIPNGFIDKSKTRVGITYTCFHDKRNTIAIIPGAVIIEDALVDYPYLNLFPVKDGVTVEDIVTELNSAKSYKRLVTTPESFGKIITAAKKMKKLQWLYDNFFLYLDEVHCYATEDFRDNILTPFDFDGEYVWQFKDMAMGSATPFRFSDPRIQALPHYKLIFKEKFGRITIVNDAKPQQVLCQMLMQTEFPDNVHIFFNSGTATGEIIRATGITDVNIYCRDEEKNMVKLGEASKYFKPQPLKGQYAKFNFYSCRYNDGWNLAEDETATIVLLTDKAIPHTLVGIPYKGFQAVGRMKVTANRIYHLTNNHGRLGMQTFEQIQAKHLYSKKHSISYYNHHIAKCKVDGMEDDQQLMNLVKPYSGIKNGISQLDHMKLDQIIYKDYASEHYNNAATIEATWQSCNYEIEVQSFNLAPVVTEKQSKEEINKQVIDRILEYKAHPEQYNFKAATATISRYKVEYQLLFQALELLDAEEIARLNYNDKAMKAALIEKSNQHAEAKLRLLLIDEFKLKDASSNKHANRYTNKYIKARLQELYDQLGICKPDGSRKLASAEQLKEFGLFELKPCKADDEQGNKKPGMEIVKERDCKINCVKA